MGEIRVPGPFDVQPRSRPAAYLTPDGTPRPAGTVAPDPDVRQRRRECQPSWRAAEPAQPQADQPLVAHGDVHRAVREVNGQDRAAGSDGGQETAGQQAPPPAD